MATSKFLRTFRTVQGTPITAATIWLVPQANTYPTGALALTPHATRDGQYYRDNVPDGEYKIYIDPAGGSSPTLYEEEIWIGEARITTISDHFDSADSYKLKETGIKDAAVTVNKLGTGAVTSVKINDQVKTLTDITTTPDYIGQIAKLGDDYYYAFAKAGVNIKWNKIKSGNFPIKNDMDGSLSIASLKVRNFIWDLHIIGTPVAGKSYSLGEIKRNSTYWSIKLYNSDIVELARFQTTVNPESGSKITFHYLAEYLGSGVSGWIAVKWDAIDDSTVYSNMFGTWYLDEKVWNGGNGLCLAHLANQTATTNTADILDLQSSKPNVTSDGKIVGAYVDPIQWEHPRGDAEYVGNYFYGLAGLAIYEQITNDVIFDRIKVNTYGGSDSVAEVRIYTGTTKTGTLASLTLLETINYSAGQFNQTSGSLMDIILTEKQRVLSGNYIYVFIAKLSGTTIRIGAWNIAYGSAPERHTFYLTANADPFSVATWSESSLPTYGSTPLLFELNEADITSVSSRVTVLETTSAIKLIPRIALPSTIYAVVDHELNLWYDAIAVNYGDDVIVNVSGTIGKAKERCWRYTPTSATSSVIVVTVSDRNGNVLETKSVTVISDIKAAGAGSKQCLFIGDSLMSGGTIPTEVGVMVAADGGADMLLLGTRGTTPNFHEGRGGWRFQDFAGAGRSFFEFTVSGVSVEPDINSTVYSNNGSQFTVQEKYITGGNGTIICERSSGTNNPSASGTLTKVSGNGDASITFSAWASVSGNPFWYSTMLDFKQYMSDNSNFGGSDTIDFAFIMLGINDVFGGVATLASVTTVINYAKDLIDGILDATYGYPSCKIVLGLSPIGGNTRDGFANNYGSFNKETYERNMRLLWEQMILEFDAGAYSANVSLGIPGVMVDRLYGYSLSAEAISSRVATTTDVHTNGVHPTASGYYQCADAFYNNFRNLV